MKPTEAITVPASPSDALTRRAISYLDSATEYQECLSCQELMDSDVGRVTDRELVLVPTLLIAALILVAVLL